MLNPKAIVLTLSFLLQFIRANAGNKTQQMLLLGVVLVATRIAIQLFLAFMARRAGYLFHSNRTLGNSIDWLSGGILVTLAGYLLLTRACQRSPGQSRASSVYA